MSERGTYVVIEGIDGTGKTELSNRLVPPLLSRGHSVSSFREPTDKFLRNEFARLLNTDALAAALCRTVDRSLLRPLVERALEHGDLVVQDRSYYSSLAYLYPGLADATWRDLERIEQELALEPDLVLYLDAPVDLALRRVAGRGGPDLFEDEPYLTKVKWKFEQMFQAPKWVRVDATGPIEHSLEQAVNALLAAGL
ncbi:MAG TPA: dTMP kinase [Thermoplasmata archaeon]|nr:dTMP kinase [Thermoplasmata archaeon]